MFCTRVFPLLLIAGGVGLFAPPTISQPSAEGVQPKTVVQLEAAIQLASRCDPVNNPSSCRAS